MSQPERKEVQIFNAALALSVPGERAAYLDQACAHDAPLRRKVEALLQACRDADDYFQTVIAPSRPAGEQSAPPYSAVSSSTDLVPLTEKSGDRIGRYKLLQQIGEGGCGVVFMAEQEEPVRRRVALKVIKLGMDTRQVVARFEAERQALAMMDHPNIARVLDAGATGTGRPYFVMELVKGVRITEYCDQNHLPTQARLDLFMKVCSAIQHAHQKGIIHRDIKPSNILVTLHDGVPVPKVIDFGIAKATEARLTDKTLFTAFEQFIGTPAYMSPEQAEMSGLDIDTRSDIYSLGVLLYELLTGKTPFDATELRDAGLDAMRRTIREKEPMRPSTRLETMLEGELTTAAKQRQSEPPKLVNLVRGDLDWIVMKALEKDRTRRYESASSFAQDVQRHLSNEPVAARPPSLLYKFQKAVRRNKPAFAAVAAVFAALVIGVGLTAWQAAIAIRAEHAARRHAAQARADRDRAVFAESNATANAIEATNALQTAHERMVKLNVAEGWRRVDEGDFFGALVPFAEAFALEEHKSDRAQIHQMRLASVLQRCPKLVNVWSVGTNARILCAKFSRDGSRLLAAITTPGRSQDTACIWDSATGRPLIIPIKEQKYLSSIDWSADESRIVLGTHDGGEKHDDGTARICEATTGRDLLPPLPHAEARVRISRDGTRLLTLGHESNMIRTFKMWNAQNGQLIWSNRVADATGILAIPMLLSPDADKVITARTILDGRTGEVLKARYTESSGPVQSDSISHDADLIDAAEYSSDGTRLFFYYEFWATLRDGRDVERVIQRWSGPAYPSRGRFSPDGSLLATGNNDATVRIWNAADGTPTVSPLEHRGFVFDVRFSLDGRKLATGTGDGEARVWDVATGRPITPWLIHDSRVHSVAFTSDGMRLFVVCDSGSVAVWDLKPMGVPRFTWSIPSVGKSHPGPRLSSDGKILLTGITNQASITWNLADGSPLLPPIMAPGYAAPTSSHLLTYDGSTWSVLSLKDGSTVTRFDSNHFANPWMTRAGAMSEDGRWLVLQKKPEKDIIVLDAVSGRLIANLGSAHSIDSDPRIRPDGQQVVARLKGGRLVHWDLSSPKDLNVVQKDYGYPLSYSAGGQWLLMNDLPMGSWGGTTVRDSRTFQQVFRDGDYDEDIRSISSDDVWATTFNDYWCRLRCLTNTSFPSKSFRHRGTIATAAFAEKGKLVISAGSDLILRFWTVPDAEKALLAAPVAAPVTEDDGILVTPDNRGFVTVHDDDTLRFWELPKSQRAVSDWLALARFFGRLRESVSGSDHPSASTGSQSFRDLWLDLRANHPELFTVSSDELDAWHRHEAWRCESRKDWSNAVHHLTELLKTQPDSGDFLPRRSAAYVARADELVAADVRRLTTNAAERGVRVAPTPDGSTAPKRLEGRAPSEKDQSLLTSAATNLLELALADYNRTLAWVDRYPAIAKESRLPFVERRREVYLKLGRQLEAEADERELKAARPTSHPPQP